MNVYFIEESRYIRVADVGCAQRGENRQRVDVGDLVWFRFPHDEKPDYGRVMKAYYMGKTPRYLVDLQKVTDHGDTP